jgi:hypothetical protein
MNSVLHKMIRTGPYSGVDRFEDVVCGFCFCRTPEHYPNCPWPTFRDNLLAVWPEWVADLNHIDMQERLDREARARAEGGGA